MDSHTWLPEFFDENLRMISIRAVGSDWQTATVFAIDYKLINSSFEIVKYNLICGMDQG